MKTKMITSVTLIVAGMLSAASAVNAQAQSAVATGQSVGLAQTVSSGPQEGGAPWSNLGGGSVGIAGQPTLGGEGTLVGGTQAALRLSKAPPFAPMLAWASYSSAPFSALGGTVYPFPYTIQLMVFADSDGYFRGMTTWPVGAPPSVYFQFIVQDLSVAAGLTLSNAVLASSPS